KGHWPGVRVSGEDFAAWLAERWDDGGAASHATELYLTCACAQGDDRAHALLKDRYLARAARGHDDDVQQLVLQALLVPRPGRRAPRWRASWPRRGSGRSPRRVACWESGSSCRATSSTVSSMCSPATSR